MPELHPGRVVDPVESVPVATHDPAFVEDTCCGPIGVPEPPDESPRQRADERMVQVAFAPDGERPALLLEVQVLDPVALGRQHLLYVPGRRLELLQLLGVMLPDRLRHRFLARSI